MPLKLGTLLVREGVINAHQLEEALRVQSLYGGRLGANLVELGFIDPDVLAEWLGKSTGFAVATADMFEEADDAVLKLITADFAEKYACFPLRQEGRRLHVAMVAPADLESVDAISFKTGLRVEPYIAPEVRVQYFLEKRYGVQRDLRYIRLSPAEMGAIPVSPSASIPPAAAVPPSAPVPGAGDESTDVAISADAAAIDDSVTAPETATPVPSPSFPPVMVPDPAVSVSATASTPSADAATDDWIVPEAAPPVDSSWLGDSEEHSHDWTPPEIPVGDAEGTSPVPPTLDFEAALAGLDEAPHREALADCVLGFGTGVLDGIMLMTCRDDMALGWRAVFKGQNEPLVDSLMLPLNVPSIFQSVSSSATSFVGPMPDHPLLAQIYKALHRPEPRFIALVPVVVRNRVVNLVYGERHDAEVDEALVQQLEALAARVTDGYERIVLNAKLAAAG